MKTPPNRRLVVGLVAAMATGCGVGADVAGSDVDLGSASAGLVSCDPSWQILEYTTGQYVAYYNVNIRTGPSTSCAAIGQAQLFDDIRLDCWRSGDDGYRWSHIKDNTNKKRGWVRNDLLRRAAAHQCR